MSSEPLKSLRSYSEFIAQLLQRPAVISSTLAVWSASPYTGVAEGEILFVAGLRLRIREELDFDAGLITSYGYEVHKEEERLYWYDDFPHPKNPGLAVTHPHHKHIPPDIKHNRIPAPQISFNQPNLSFLLDEIEALIGMQ